MLFRMLSIRACVRDLSQRLARSYGIRESYTIEEIRTAMDQWDMKLSYPAYAFALYAARPEFERLEPAIRGGRDYEEWRSDVRRRYRRLHDLSPEGIAVFARSYWTHLGVARSSVDLPDSFEKKSQR
jgi:uncharacterized protein DUF6559